MGNSNQFDMASRGVTRPMALMHHQRSHEGGERQNPEQQAGGDQPRKQPDNGNQHRQHQHGHDAAHMLAMHHQHTLWVYWSLIILGGWLLVAPFSLGYLNESLWCQPSGGRGAWWSDQTLGALRAHLMVGSDLISGLLLCVFGLRSLKPDRPVSLWICGLVGMWLVTAPVLFWAPTPGAFHNGSFVGMLVISLTILIPGMPNMIKYMQHGPGTPPGWSYNPSSWPQRWILIATGFAGYLASRHLAMFQLGYLDDISDPFFGAGTERVLNSKMSHAWPISDAGLGTVSYTFEFLMGFMGSPKRWRTMPWMVAFFGILVIPLGLVHIFLVISQPLVVGHWCTLCLLAAGIMVPMIPLEVDEVVAMVQHVRQAHRRGDRNGSLWAIFWKGGTAEGCTEDERSPALSALPDQPRRVFASMFWGFSVPWNLVATTTIGVWLMFQPAALGQPTGGGGTVVAFEAFSVAGADVFHLAGALLVVCSVIAMGETVRAFRYLNLPVALLLASAPWAASGHLTSAVLGTLLGAAAFALSLRRGPIKERYGAWNKLIV